MATFKKTTGSRQTSRRAIVSDAVVSGSNTTFTLDQPANSIITDVIFRVMDPITLATGSTQDVGLKVGSTDGGAEYVTAATDAIIDAGDALTVAEGFTLQYSVTGQYNTAAVTDATGVLSNDEKLVYVAITNPASDTVDAAGKLAVEVVFREFGN